MSTSFRHCLHCDYMLPADGAQVRCPECGLENNFFEIDTDAEAALATPMRTILRGRAFSSAMLRKSWCSPPSSQGRVRRLAVIALLVGFVFPASLLMLSAATSLKTTVQCLPHRVDEIQTPNGIVHIGSPYHRPAFIEYNWFSWNGWDQYSDQEGEWASRCICSFEKIDRKLIGRSIVVHRVWKMWPQSILSDFGLIAATLATWWVLAAVWLALVKMKLRSGPTANDAIASYSNIKTFSYLVLATSGILLSVLVAIDLVTRLTIPEIGISFRGNQWYDLSKYVPWSIAIPAVLLWRVSSKGPPGVARWATWPTLAIAAACAILVKLFARLKTIISPPGMTHADGRRGDQAMAVGLAPISTIDL